MDRANSDSRRKKQNLLKDRLEETVGQESAGGGSAETVSDLSYEGDTGTREAVLPQNGGPLPSLRRRRALPNPDTPKAPAPRAPRYTIKHLLGVGTSGRVFAVHDSVLLREVAVKVLDRKGSAIARQRFSREAQIAADLEHPSIMPIYDMDTEIGGEAYFTMKQIRGESLAGLIEERVAGKGGCDRLADTDEIVRVFLKLCDAVGFAHSRSVIHQDIKPANVMVGDFGEVILVDWGTARRLGADEPSPPSPTGSPAYMSPEQARCQGADERSDIYALGASLFQTLTLRHPTGAPDATVFWERKKRGEIDAPTDEESRRVPGQLLAICLKALAADPEQRYQRVAEMAQDLKNYQAGLAVSVYHDSFVAWAGRWYRRNRQAFWATAVVIAVLATSGTVLYRWKLREMARWGRPVLSEAFSDDTYRSRWVPLEGHFARSADSRLVTDDSHGPGSRLFLRQKLYGSVAVEFEGQFEPGAPPGDLSVIWCERLVMDSTNTRVDSAVGGYLLQAGAYDNTVALISTDRGQTRLAEAAYALAPSHTYRIRAEIDGPLLTLSIDGHEVCRYETLFPVSSGYIGLYGYYAGKAFDNVRVFVKGVPQRVKVTAVGDSYYRQALYERAAYEYGDVVRSLPKTHEADEARYKQGLCLYQLGEIDSALGVWRGLRGEEYQDLAACHRVEYLVSNGPFREALAEIEPLYARAGTRVRQQLVSLWRDYLGPRVWDLRRQDDASMVLDWGIKTFAPGPMRDMTVAQSLRALGRCDELERDYPEQSFEVGECLYRQYRYQDVLERNVGTSTLKVRTLIALDRAEEALERFSRHTGHVHDALQSMGRYEEILELPGVLRSQRISTFLAMGRVDEALALDADSATLELRMALGRASEIAADTSVRSEHRANALLRLDRYQDILQDTGIFMLVEARFLAMALSGGSAEDVRSAMPSTPEPYLSYVLRFLEYVEQPDARAREAFDDLPAVEFGFADTNLRFGHNLLVPFLLMLEGDRAALDSAYGEIVQNHRLPYAQTLWHDAAFVLGTIDDIAYGHQPHQKELEGRLRLCRAMRAERDGDPAALNHYRAYLAMPYWQRPGDALMLLFARWRVRELSGAATS